MTVIENPIINSPFEEPKQHYELDKRGNPTGEIIPVRRKSIYLQPVAQPRKSSNDQLMLWQMQNVTENVLINQIRERVKAWRNSNYPFVTRVTRQLLDHWLNLSRQKPLFFCQIEALETAIYLTEVVRKRTADADIEKTLQTANEEANPGLYRIAFKMATGSGKTVVMAMLIAWQALNKFNSHDDKRFSDAFLIVRLNG